jgi:hypothetical protein
LQHQLGKATHAAERQGNRTIEFFLEIVAAVRVPRNADEWANSTVMQHEKQEKGRLFQAGGVE